MLQPQLSRVVCSSDTNPGLLSASMLCQHVPAVSECQRPAMFNELACAQSKITHKDIHTFLKQLTRPQNNKAECSQGRQAQTQRHSTHWHSTHWEDGQTCVEISRTAKNNGTFSYSPLEVLESLCKMAFKLCYKRDSDNQASLELLT